MNTKPKKKRRKDFWNYVSVESPLDERQELLSAKINLEGIGATLILVLINIFIMDDVYKWCERYSSATMLIVYIAALYIIIKRGIKGCLFGVKGARSELLTITAFLFIGVLQIGENIKWAFRGWFPEITRDGMLTLEFCNQLMFLFMFADAIAMSIFVIREKRAKKRRAESLDKEEL